MKRATGGRLNEKCILRIYYSTRSSQQNDQGVKSEFEVLGLVRPRNLSGKKLMQQQQQQKKTSCGWIAQEADDPEAKTKFEDGKTLHIDKKYHTSVHYSCSNNTLSMSLQPLVPVENLVFIMPENS